MAGDTGDIGDVADLGRRQFIFKSAALMAGGVAGFNPFLKALAHEAVFRPRISIIIDDVGFSLSRANHFLELDFPLTYSVLPRLRDSLRIAEMIHGQGHEVMIHQPMEPYNGDIDPGPCALYVDDHPDKIRAILESNLSDFPFAVGINNHMGSRFTSSESCVSRALQIIKSSNRFFLDSITSSHSKGYQTALRLHMPAGRRDIFLDNSPDEINILKQLKRLMARARTCGQAVGIGHPYPQTVRALKWFIKQEDLSGYYFTHISNIIYPERPVHTHV